MNKDIIFIYGNFNIVHPGHLRLLRFAKSLNGELHVGVASDQIAADEAHVPEKLRLEALKTNNWVDKAFIYKDPIIKVIKKLKPHIVVKGKEYEHQYNEEADLIASYGGKLVFSSGDVSFSSLDLLKKEMISSSSLSILDPIKFNKRHNIDKKIISTIVKKFKSKSVCVIGDLIIDEYIACEALGMSQEDPTLVVKPISSSVFIGGAGIVASHSAGLGASTHFISAVGNDSNTLFAKKELKTNGVISYLIQDESRPTTLKQRFRSKGKTLLRVSTLSENSINKDIQNKILKKLKTIIKEIDLIIFSDFNYGVLPQNLVDDITKLAKNNKVMIAADSQSSSQTGDISRFLNVDLISPTEREARLSLRDNQMGLVSLSKSLLDKTSARNILLKLGEEGILVHPGKENLSNEVTDRIGALNQSPKDVAGAGDSLLVSSSLALLCESNIWEAAYIGSIAAAIQVGRVGNSPMQSNEILNHLSKQ
tara:strand:+ start:12640 stop:14079 length:1440 start_codon:yes stop_codon:yes gene_type:complete